MYFEIVFWSVVNLGLSWFILIFFLKLCIEGLLIFLVLGYLKYFEKICMLYILEIIFKFVDSIMVC